MKKSILYILVVVILSACGDTEATRQRLDRQQRLEQQRQDSLALKIAVLPTLDGLPLFLAHEHRMFDTLGVDVRSLTMPSTVVPRKAVSQSICAL